jgi:hypothetical protein
MKKLFLFGLFFCFTGFAIAQENPSDSTIIKADTSESKSIVIDLSLGKKRVKTRFFLFEMGINSYHNEGNANIPTSLEMYELRHARSLEVNLHVYRQRIKIGKGYFNIEHGLSFDLNHYAFQNAVNFRTDPVEELYIDNNSDIQRSRLYMSHLNLPLMLHFETNPKKLSKSFHIGVGAYAGVRLGSNLKTRTSTRDKNKIVDNFGLNDFNYGLRAELGYGPVNLYAKYAMLDLFKNGRGPSLTPFSVGFTIIPF